MTTTPEALSLWVVYDHPRDFPEHFVARRHVCYGPQAGPTSDVFLSPDLEVIRDEMERQGLTLLMRSPDDEPHIVETWL